MTPARVLARKTKHQLPHLRRQRRTPDPTGRLAPPPPHQRLMPPQQRPRRDQHHCPRGARQVMRGGGQQCSIWHSELRPSNLAAQNLELVPQHQQLNVLHVQAAATPNKRRQQRPKREVEEGEGHAADPPNPRAQEQRHQYWREVGSRAANAARRTTRKIGRLGTPSSSRKDSVGLRSDGFLAQNL